MGVPIFRIPSLSLDQVFSYGVHHVDWVSLEGMPSWAMTTSFDEGVVMDASAQYCITAFGTPSAGNA